MRIILTLLAIPLTGVCSVAQEPARPKLEERVQRLEDQRAIREVLVRYGEHLDARDYAGYAALFAADGTSVTGFGSATGPAAIAGLLEANRGKPPPGYLNQDRFHLMTTAVVETAGNRAAARSRYTVFAASPQGRPAPVHAGRYLDELVREDGGWKIRRRTSHGVLPYRAPIEPRATE